MVVALGLLLCLGQYRYAAEAEESRPLEVVETATSA
jgi:hypothetical protein